LIKSSSLKFNLQPLSLTQAAFSARRVWISYNTLKIIHRALISSEYRSYINLLRRKDKKSPGERFNCHSTRAIIVLLLRPVGAREMYRTQSDCGKVFLVDFFCNAVKMCRVNLIGQEVAS
jgi:hypothetical protein